MLHYERLFECPELGVTMNHRALMSPSVRIYEIETRGILFDQGKLEPRELVIPGRTQANFVCDGILTLRRPQGLIALERGQVFVEGGIRFDEVWEGEPFRAICVEWSSLGTEDGEVHRLSARGIETLRGLTLSVPRAERVAEASEAIGVLMEETGVDIPMDDSKSGVDPDLQHIVDVYASLVSDLRSQPMWCDFTNALGMSERQLRRRVSEFLAWFPTPLDEMNFRSALKRVRMARGMALMTAPGATVSRVARLLGYSSSVAFANACHSAGLGAPSGLSNVSV